MANDYITLAEFKEALPANNASLSTIDPTISAAITRASRAIDRYTNRKPGSYKVTADSVLYFDSPLYGRQSQGYSPDPDEIVGYSEGMWARSLWIGELAAAPTEVAVSTTGGLQAGNYTAWATGDYILWPYNALDAGEPYRRIDIDILNGSQRTWYWYRRCIRVTGKFGYSATPPEPIQQATIAQAARYIKRGQQAYQDRTELLGQSVLVYTDRIDSDLQELLANYRRIGL